ncbi:cytochrome b/b6 domain-containing protein [Sulfurimonas sp.]
MMTKQTYIWSLATRLFHIFLIISVATAYIVSDFEKLLPIHVAFGYTVALLFTFRIVWGFMDVKYSKFSDFNFNIKDLLYYLTHVFGEKKEYAGHNPASSWAIIAMIVLGFLTVISGTLVYGTQEGMGILSFLNHTIFKKMELFEELHEIIANSFMLVVGAHIAGVLLDTFVHKSSVIVSMINGHKDVDAQSLKLTLLQKVFAVFWLSTSALFLVYMLQNPNNALLADTNEKINYNQEHPLFAQECSSCHILYPPFLLPESSWNTMMDDLENHFGDDASLDKADVLSIRNYLLSHSANNSTKEAAFYILQSLENNSTIAITKTPYWIKRHKNIDKNIFHTKKVLKKSNCKACHKNFEQGLLNDSDIEIPKG